MSKPSRRPVSIARCAICTGVWPATIGRLGTCACSASCANCSCAAGRCVSRLASSTFRRSRSRSRSASLPDVVVLPEPCRPTIRIGIGAGGVQVERDRALAAQRLDHHVVDDLDHLLAGRDRGQHLGADGPLAHLGDEVAHHRQRHVGVQQREADLAQRLGDVGLGQRAAAAQAVEHAGELVGQRFEHGVTPTGKTPLREPSRSGGAPASGGDRVATLPGWAGLCERGVGESTGWPCWDPHHLSSG